jgi:hypothetical protein
MDKASGTPEEKKRLTVEKVDELFKIAEDWNDIRQIMVNANYYVGNQWIGWNRSERKIQALPQEANQERITLNKIRPRVMTLLAKHTKNKLKFDVVAASKEQQDIDAAKAADKYIKSLWDSLDFTGKTRDIFLNCLIKKRVWVKTWFDSEAGDDITPKEGETGYKEDMGSIHKGEIRARVCDPLTIFADPAATTEEEIRWIIERKARDVDELKAEYGKEVSPDANLDYLNAYDVTRVSGDGIASNEVARKKNMALVYELWMKPCKLYPRGAKLTKANNIELDYTDNAGELPYNLIGYIPIPGTLTYDAIVTDMLPVQRGINIKRSMIATTAKMMGNNMWLNPMGSGIDEEDLTNEISGVLNYNPAANMKPERVQAPDIPSFYQNDLQNDAIDLDDMSGSREVSQGSMPKGLDTLGGLQIMVEQENEKLTVASQNYEQGMKKVMQRILRLLKKHYTEERQARIVGADNEIEIVSFMGSDLTGNEDINVIQGSSLPDMKAAQQERIMLMWSSGAIVKKDGTPDPTTLLRLMGLGDSTELFEQHELDENNAKMEDKQFEDIGEDPQALQVVEMYLQQTQVAMQEIQRIQQETGFAFPPEMIQELVPPLPEGLPDIWDSDDDEVHIYVHNTFRKTSRYRKLPKPLRDLVDMHYQKHVDRLNAPMIAQQQAEQAAMAQQAEGEDKNRQHESQMNDKKHEQNMQAKSAEQQARMQGEQMKANTALQTAAMKL